MVADDDHVCSMYAKDLRNHRHPRTQAAISKLTANSKAQDNSSSSGVTARFEPDKNLVSHALCQISVPEIKSTKRRTTSEPIKFKSGIRPSAVEYRHE